MSDPPSPVLGVVSPAGGEVRFRPSVPVTEREALCRLAAEILRDSGAAFGAGEIIVLAGWLGGMD